MVSTLWTARLLGAAVVALLLALAVIILSDDGDEEEPLAAVPASAMPRPSIETVIALMPTATPAVTPTPFPYEAPERRDFAPGELIDISPAVVFVDADSGAATAWVFQFETVSWEFGVAPSGTYIVYQKTDGVPAPPGGQPNSEVRLLRTDSGSDAVIEAEGLPVEYGPGESGFVALRDGGSAAGVFSGLGDLLFEIPLQGEFLDAAWSEAGGMIAVASRFRDDDYEIRIHRLASGGQLSLLSDRLAFSEAWIAIAWSHGGQELAVVAPNRVFVTQARGSRLWEAPGDVYFGNPRWSPGDAYLFVSALPSVFSGTIEPELSYVFNAQGVALFRLVTAQSGGCLGDPWLASDRFQLGADVWSVDGQMEQSGVPRLDIYPDLSAIGVSLASGIGYHVPHWGPSDNTRSTEAGRVVFTTPEVGHGGCGTSVAGSFEEGPIVQRPPFGAWAP